MWRGPLPWAEGKTAPSLSLRPSLSGEMNRWATSLRFRGESPAALHRSAANTYTRVALARAGTASAAGRWVRPVEAVDFWAGLAPPITDSRGPWCDRRAFRARRGPGGGPPKSAEGVGVVAATVESTERPYRRCRSHASPKCGIRRTESGHPPVRLMWLAVSLGGRRERFRSRGARGELESLRAGLEQLETRH